MKRARRRNREAGLTLIELLITIVVASLVAGSTFVFFAGQQHIYETQTKLLNVQQNLWMAMEVITRGVRASGGGAFTGCPTVRAYRSGVGMITLGGFVMTNGAAGAPDQLTLGNFSGGSGNFVDTMLNSTMNQNYPGSAIHTTDHKPFRTGEFILVLDTQSNPPNGGDRGCTVYQITNVPGNSDNLITNPTSDWNGNGPVPGLVPWDYTGGAGGTYGIRNLGTLGSQIRYFIDSTGAPAVPPRLMVDDLLDATAPAVLAEGIEDMQVAYACDRLPAVAPDGALTEGTDAATRLADEWVFNQTGDVVPAGCAVPTAIRITLVGRSLTEDIGLFGTSGSGAVTGSLKPAVEDGVAGAPDAFRHRTLTTTIFPRN